MNKREIGACYERKTAQYIQNQGMKCLEMNYVCPRGEIDLIAMDRENLVFIEVKYRGSLRYGHPSQAVDFRKQQKIIQSALWYMMDKKMEEIPVRFDVACWIGEKLEYHKGAFDYYG